MRIVNSSSLAKRTSWRMSLMLSVALGLVPFFSSTGYAAMPLSPVNAPASMPSNPVIDVPAPMPAPSVSGANGMAIDPTSLDVIKAPGADMNKTVSNMEEKVSDNAKGLLKRLDKSSDAMTLEDMNEARQTVARIEAIIDIEKHLVELDKIRKERSGEGSSLASAIPASALTPFGLPHMPTASPLPFPSPAEGQAIHRMGPATPSYTISRITGTDGRYSAVLKLANGDLKSVRVGEQVSPGVTVQAIASSSVILDENGKTLTLHIKNVDVIYSAMR